MFGYCEPRKPSPLCGRKKGYMLANLGDDVLIEEYDSQSASTGRNYFVISNGRYFFGCDLEILFEIDEKFYRKIQPAIKMGIRYKED